MDQKPRFKPAPALITQSARKLDRIPERLGGSSLTSERARGHLVQKLKTLGITNQRVLDVIGTVPRHLFVDEAFASRAYEDAALPIGHQQTISRPFTVARFAEYALDGRTELDNVLEVGAGCGYQAAVLSHVATEVYSIERLRGLHEKARTNLRPFRLHNVHLIFGDGMLGYPKGAPYAGIISAAGGDAVPDTWLEQLAVGGRLIAPTITPAGHQALVVILKTAQGFERQVLEAVHFVPLKSGVA